MRIEVEVKFRRDFVKVEGNIIVVGLTSKPKKGKANLELIRKLARLLLQFWKSFSLSVTERL